jgi:UDPglucose 6-dehydrogenase
MAMASKPITVIGIGKLGLGFALMLEAAGYDVLGVDISHEYVGKLNAKIFHSSEPHYNEMLQQSQNFRATTKLDEGLSHSDILFILVQTPNGGGDKFYDHSILSTLLRKINQFQPQNKHFIIGCTVMPTYINQIGKPLLDNCENCSLNYNPEFIAQGDIIKGFSSPDMILFGKDDSILDEQERQDAENAEETLEHRIREIYVNMTKNTELKFCFMTTLEAEIVKISLNGFITTKLSYANMISDYCDTIGADKYTVLDAIGSDTRIGAKYFKPGFSFGGPCFPRDTKALKQCLDKVYIQNHLLEATTQYNEWHVDFQTEQWWKEIIQKNEENVVVEGVCYKEGSKIPIIEESAKLKIATKLAKCVPVTIRDTPEIIEEVRKEYGNLFTYEYLSDE